MRQGGTLQRLEHEHDIDCDQSDEDCIPKSDAKDLQSRFRTKGGFKGTTIATEMKPKLNGKLRADTDEDGGSDESGDDDKDDDGKDDDGEDGAPNVGYKEAIEVLQSLK